jgi:hypothetical protein
MAVIFHIVADSMLVAADGVPGFFPGAANLTGKKQSYIARVEKGTQNINVQTLSDIVESAGGKLKIEVVV